MSAMKRLHMITGQMAASATADAKDCKTPLAVVPTGAVRVLLSVA